MSSANRSALFFGLVLIVVGALFLLNNVGWLPPAAARLWPVLLIVAGVWLLGNAFWRRQGGGLVGGAVALTAGVMLLLQNFNFVPESAFGPVMIIAVGAGLLLRGLVRRAPTL